MNIVSLKKLMQKIYRKPLNEPPIPEEVIHIPEKPEDMWGRVFDLEQKELAHLDNFNLYVMRNDYIGQHILTSRSYEPHVTKLIKNILKMDDVFLDIGANLGYFTMLASSIVKEQGKVIAFEPNPQNLQLIYSSIQENHAKNIDVYPFAASNHKNILRFVTVGSNGGIVTEHALAQQYNFLVQSVILDTMLKNEPAINLIKMDVEAHEPYALAGMINLIKQHKPKLITEFHPWALKINNPGKPIEFLNQVINLGYKISIIQFDGELKDVSSSEEILSYWESLQVETIHLDLFAQPLL